MKARDLLIQLTTLCAQNPQVLDKEVEITFPDSSIMNPVSIELGYPEVEEVLNFPGVVEDAVEPESIVINVL